ncbi:hypothetical protein L7F22_007079 [Adiantum nelumboides]|nr:hypothetical protein [Adiantum nelumboides]
MRTDGRPALSRHRTFQDSLNCYMLMEYVIGGEIFSHLRRAGRFSVDVTRFYTATLLLAIRHLHSRNIVYRDLKPENLLLDETGYIKMTDFGFAKHLCDERTWTLCGTPEYLAPEIIESKGHGRAADYWALGVLMFEMICGHPPYFGSDAFATYEKILAGDLRFPAHVDADTKHLITSLLEPDVSKRMGNLAGGAEDMMNHRWFLGVDWSALEAKRIAAPIVPGNLPPGDTSMFQKYSTVDLKTMPGLASGHSHAASAYNPQKERGSYDHLFGEF